MSLADAIAYARAHHPATRVARAETAARIEAAKVPSAEWLPEFGVTAQLYGATANQTTGSTLSTSVLDLPRIGGTRAVSPGTLKPYASTLVALGGRQEVYDFGRIAARTAAEDALVSVQQHRAETELLDVTLDVQEAYFAVSAAKQVVRASSDAYDRARAHRDLARAGVGSGLRPPIELTRAESELAKLEIARIRAQGSVEAAESVFAAVVGVPDAALDIDGDATTPAALPDLQKALEEAGRREPRLLAALAELTALEKETRAVGAESRPDLFATATVSGRAGGAPPSGNGEPADAKGFLPNVPNWDVGLVFSWPIYDGVVDAREKAARAVERVQQERVALVRQENASRVRQAYVAVRVALEALPRLAGAIEAARANYDQADARFRAGMGTSVELADAEAVRTDAEIALALGTFDLARARAVFGRAIAEGT